MSNESFESLFESNLNPENFMVGRVIKASVLEVRPDRIIVNAGLKSDAFIDRSEFGDRELAVGDMVEVVIESLENGFGETRLSHEKARRAAKWQELETLHNNNETVHGHILERVKGGFTVSLEQVQAFLPGSLIDVKPVRDPSYLEDKELEFKIIKMDQKRNNIVVSRRAVLEEENSSERMARIEELQEGQEIQGVVKNITDYGAFVDLGGADGLLHITDMAWKRVKHPSELMKVGDEINVKILKFDREKNRVSLGMKQLGEDPWVNISRRYPTGTRVYGRVTNVTDYGCFVEIEEGVEGLVHMSEMDWTNKNVHPSKVVQTNDETEVVILEINEERRRISLGIKQCKDNPWETFAATAKEGDKVKGHIRSITDFGLFVGLDGEIDGLVHLSDISWTEAGETAVRQFKRGDEIAAVILSLDPERERISLGIKQLDDDPIAGFIDSLAPSYTLTATVKEVDPRKAIIDLGQATAVMKASEYQHARTDDLSAEISVGDSLEVRIMNPDRKNGKELSVSHKATLAKPKNISAEEAANTTLGDLLKEQMDDASE